MSTPLRILQQENIRLNAELAATKSARDALYAYLSLIKELYFAWHKMESERHPDAALTVLLDKTLAAIGAGDGSISRIDHETDELVFMFVGGELKDRLVGYRISSQTGIAGWVIENQSSITINNPRQDWRFSEVVDETFRFSTESIVSVPILSEGQVVGVIQCLNKQKGEFNEADVALLLVLGQVASLVLKLPNVPPPPGF